MKNKFKLFLTKWAALQMLWKSDQWFIACNDPKTNKTNIAHGSMPVESLSTVSKYIQITVDLEYNKRSEVPWRKSPKMIAK
jgi:hypothetical protein